MTIVRSIVPAVTGAIENTAAGAGGLPWNRAGGATPVAFSPLDLAALQVFVDVEKVPHLVQKVRGHVF